MAAPTPNTGDPPWNPLTSRGPGTAVAFALAIVEHLCGRAKRDAVAGQLLVD